MTTNLALFKTLVLSAFREEVNPTEDQIVKVVNAIISVPVIWGGGELSDQYIADLILEIKEKYGVRMDLGHFLDNQDAEFEAWLEARIDDIDWYYWKRYKQHLVEEGFPRDVVSVTEERVIKTLSRIGDPRLNSRWDRRGMVVGSVQSGKTANYIGLCAMAADAGYKVIIIIAGIQTNLRNQTQERVDKGLIGRDSSAIFTKNKSNIGSRDYIVGVGHIDPSRYPTSFTNKYQDFSRHFVGVNEQLDPSRKEPVIFVIKKNTKTLENLINWLRKNSQSSRLKIDLPLLLIDDEADNASINIAYKRDDISKINGQIRDLLCLFQKSSYVGFTATPFANIFIDPESNDQSDDLFPRDFIVSLDPPSNYLGPERIFLAQDEPSQWLREIDDWEGFMDPSHKIDFEPTNLSSSLRSSIRYFMLVVAIRHLRGDDGDKDNSMLINVSRFSNVQRKLRLRVDEYLQQLGNSIVAYADMPNEEWRSDPTMQSLHETFQNECRDLNEKWHDVIPKLRIASRKIQTRVINSKSPDSLVYRSLSTPPLSVIAIGGFSLSRGLTLEGLSVSYFLRNSLMYDTLMQMGRWFGYRSRYEDLCRIWMTSDAIGWYQHIAESTQELKDEFLRMEQNNMSPSQFGLCVRTHPDTLVITARNKMGAASKVTRSISLDERFIETHALLSSKAITEANLKCFADFYETAIKSVCREATAKRFHDFFGSFIADIDCRSVLSLISRFKVHPASAVAYGDPLQKYISKRVDGELALWDVFIASKENGTQAPKVFAGLDIALQQRTIGKTIDQGYTVGSRQKVSGRGIEKVGLSEEQVRAIQVAAGTTSFSDKRYRQVVGRKPLLVLHLLELRRKDDSQWTDSPVPAWSISLPSTKLLERTEEYLVNPVWLQEMTDDESEDTID